MRDKLNKLLINWVPGAVMTASYLKQKGYSASLLQDYTKNGWIEKISNGVYKKKNDNPNIYGFVHALQSQLNLNVFIGGPTALGLQGKAHFIKKETVYIFYKSGEYLPLWFRKMCKQLEAIIVRCPIFGQCFDIGLVDYELDLLTIKISSVERSLLELFSLIPERQSFVESSLIMDGMYVLNFELMQTLLNTCTSVKVNRIFLFLAKYHNLPIYKELELNSIYKGSGKRQIEIDGRLDPEFNITVPRELFESENELDSYLNDEDLDE